MSIKIKNINDTVFLGKVVNSDDPLFMFRCKVKVVGMFDDIEDDLLPWVFPKNSASFAGSGFGDGQYPKVGTWVKVEFPHNDIYSGEYYGIPNIEPALQTELNGDYKNSIVFAYDIDEELKVMYTQAQGFLISSGENIINIKKIDGEIIITADSKVIIEAPKIELSEGANEPIMLGDSFNAIWKIHSHVGNLGAPTGPPLQPIDTALSKRNTSK